MQFHLVYQGHLPSNGNATVKQRIRRAFHPQLQELSAAQKQLLRMGPQNVRTVQSKLREIATALGIPASRLPPVK